MVGIVHSLKYLNNSREILEIITGQKGILTVVNIVIAGPHALKITDEIHKLCIRHIAPSYAMTLEEVKV